MNLEKKPISFEKTKDEMWDYMIGYFQDNRFTPTHQEIADYFNERHEAKHSRQWVGYYLKHLIKEGRIGIERNKNRGIKLILK